MTRTTLTRRELLKIGLLSLGAAGTLAFRSRLPAADNLPIHGLGRVCWDWLPVRETPSFNALQVGRRDRDQVIPLIEKLESPDGPAYNPRWYRLLDGYLFSGYVQPVEVRYQKPADWVSEEGRIGEVSVPYTNSRRYFRSTGWEPLYRLYYRSMHWITDVISGPDRTPWYEITDDLHRQKYYVRASHIRLVGPSELDPISPQVALEDKRIEVVIAEQKLRAYEQERLVLETSISSGIPQVGEPANGIPTDTPFGAFRINRKMPVRHMGNGDLVADLNAYELPGVPWVCYFVATGVAFHGAYWHDNFGRRMSHGCVNMTPDDARWLFRWTLPESGPDAWYSESPGTRVQVI